MDTCAKCGAGLGVGRFCLNCGHPIGAPVSHDEETWWAPQDDERPPEGEIIDDDAPTEGNDWLLTEVGDPEEPAETLPRVHWVVWMLVAAVLVVAVLLGAARLLGGDGSPADSATSGTSSAGTGASAGGSTVRMPGGRPIDVARGAKVAVPATAPPSTDFDGTLVSYSGSRMVDGKRRTAWRMRGDATGKKIRLLLDEPAVINRVGLVNGYAKKVASVDWYPHNRRIRSVTWGFDGGAKVEQRFTQRRKLQTMEIEPVRVRWVTITIREVTRPGPGPLGRDYTAISSVVLSGRPAG